MSENKNKKEALNPAMLAAAAAAAAGAAGAGYYFYASKEAEENRRIAARWARELKNDVVRQAKKIQDLDRGDLMNIVDGAAKMYESVRGLDKNDLYRAADELKQNWNRLQGELMAREPVRDVRYIESGHKRKASKKKTSSKKRAKKKRSE